MPTRATKKAKLNRREVQAKIFLVLAYGSLMIASLILVGIFLLLILKGVSTISLDFLTQATAQFGASGGIAFQILGSLILVVVAGVLSFPISYSVAVFISEYVSDHRKKKSLLSLLQTLNTVPSIAYGIFGLIFFVYILQTGISWFVGSIILALMMLPTITMASYQAINAIPTSFREQGYALGFDRSQVIRCIILPRSAHGAATGLMIGIAAAIGETAPIMFVATAFSGVTIPLSLNEPVATLPTHILALAQQATNTQALDNAWGAALTLIIIVLAFSSISLFVRLRLTPSINR